MAHALLSLAIAQLSIATACAQEWRLGLKAGVPATAYFETGIASSHDFREEYSAATRRYTVGAAVERDFNHRFGLELDALFHRMGYVALKSGFAESTGRGFNYAIDIKGNSWDFPLLAKFRLHRAFRPFLSSGGILRYAGPVRGRGQNAVYNRITGVSSTTPLDTSDPPELSRRFYPGLSLAVGGELGHRRVRFLPEFRYTRWLANISHADDLLRFTPNQAEFLVGILF